MFEWLSEKISDINMFFISFAFYAQYDLVPISCWPKIRNIFKNYFPYIEVDWTSLALRCSEKLWIKRST